MGFVIPLAVTGTILLSLGSGLYSILRPGSPTEYWVGFQLLAGIGSGLSMQLVSIWFSMYLNTALAGHKLLTI